MNQKKTINPAHQQRLFNILNCVVEYKVAHLNHELGVARAAARDIPQLQRDVKELQASIGWAARYDPSDNDGDDMARLDNAETRLREMTARADAIPDIMAQIGAAKSFRAKYNLVMARRNLPQLMAQQSALADEMGRVSDKIESAEINLDTAADRTADVIKESADELAKYRACYETLSREYDIVCRQITAITR